MSLKVSTVVFNGSLSLTLTLQAELETWAAALKAYDEEDFEKSLEMFSVRPI